MFLAKHPLTDFQRLSIERFGLIQPSLGIKIVSDIVVAGGG